MVFFIMGAKILKDMCIFFLGGGGGEGDDIACIVFHCYKPMNW